MTVHTGSCFWVLCAVCGNGWDAAIPHMPSAEAALGHARDAGWMILPRKATCPACTQVAVCRATGHDFEAWRDNEALGIAFRIRVCGSCDVAEYDPPLPQIQVQLDAYAIVDIAAGGETT